MEDDKKFRKLALELLGFKQWLHKANHREFCLYRCNPIVRCMSYSNLLSLLSSDTTVLWFILSFLHKFANGSLQFIDFLWHLVNSWNYVLIHRTKPVLHLFKHLGHQIGKFLGIVNIYEEKCQCLEDSYCQAIFGLATFLLF